MSKQRQEVLVDDLDGSPADETIKITINGDEYVIDLSKTNATKFWATWSPWLSKAQRVVRRRKRTALLSRGRAVMADAAKVRAWARERGIPVNENGYPQTAVELEFIKDWVEKEMQNIAA